MLVCNLGCGDDTYGDYRVDINKTKATTHVFDVEKGFKFDDNMFDEVCSRNLLEHLRNVGFHLDECYRILKTNGKVRIITDNAECIRYYWFGTHTGKYEKENEPNDKHFEVFTKSHLLNHFRDAGFRDITLKYIATDTNGRYFDMLTFNLLGYPRIEVTAIK